jgi:low affinity Fe/Cu permease
MGEKFAKFAHQASTFAGHYVAFMAALLLLVIWGVSGPIFGFSDTWQLVINTTTTIITFLMVFLIQNTQNRDALAMHLKLDELIHSIESADNRIIRAEDESDEELTELKRRYEALIDEHEALKARLDPSTAPRVGMPAASGRHRNIAVSRIAQACLARSTGLRSKR